MEQDTGSSAYELCGFISHRGPSASCGHYVAYILVKEHGWVLFNDDKVVLVPEIDTHVVQAYMLLYRRKFI